ncbi:hypothetical protein [Litoreibacter albidus]|uniref:Uncharacterized protein n=1 Tax=Litoreibacter albidus TaxID=670155 RepID=A0A1H2Y8C8_9RHOB|nr:hypothetical protein [Litoreibacter albidus]SDX00924.1 hypothetical protein SAMN04488001_2238 [Litoreibacter albidus]
MNARLDQFITILEMQIPVRENTKLYAGFEALRSCDGKTYRKFRDLCGGPKGSPERQFSPSTVLRIAEEEGFARLELSIGPQPGESPVISNTSSYSFSDQVLTALKAAASDNDVQEIIRNEAEVIGRFGPIFHPHEIGTISEDDFRDFLKFENNKHWTTLERQKNRLCEDMDDLREALSVLVDETRPIANRFDEASELRGLGKGTMSAILLVAYPDRYGVWNGVSEAALLNSGLWPKLDRGATKGEKYDAICQVLRDIAQNLNISLWTLDSLWWRANFDNDEIEPSQKRTSPNPPQKNEGRVLGCLEKSIWEIKNSVLETVKNSNGQIKETTVKNKELLMSDQELEVHIRELLEQGNRQCAITGLNFEFVGDGDNKHLRPSLDRIDSNGHYEKSNVQLVCRFVNFWKQATPDSEFRDLIRLVRESVNL